MLLLFGQNLGMLGGVSGVTVPNVVGQTQASGTTELEDDGFVVMVATAYSSVVASGSIISQSPAAGTEQASGSTITITVSMGEQTMSRYRTHAVRKDNRPFVVH
jgi:beta-lactam-binding protein with PASTA domain